MANKLKFKEKVANILKEKDSEKIYQLGKDLVDFYNEHKQKDLPDIIDLHQLSELNNSIKGYAENPNDAFNMMMHYKLTSELIED